MILWITENLGTIIISLILILMVAGIIRSIIRDKRNGVSACGGNCAHCHGCTACLQESNADRR